MPWPRVHDSRILAALLSSLVVLAWWALWLGESSAWGHALVHRGGAMHGGGSPAALAAIFVLGWTLMTVAMMLPTSSPLILLFHRMVGGRPHAGWLVALLGAGYLAVWILFGAVVYLLSRAIHKAAAAVPWLAENAWAPGAAIFLGAGLYQFTPLKYACLDKCRSPMTFLIERWRGNRAARDAFRLGVEHGIYCVGCCWSLMLVMFAVGAASAGWMLGLGAVMAAEKNLPWGRRLSAPVGAALIAAAALMCAGRPRGAP
jgi:predicted metal-binding membrane protein